MIGLLVFSLLAAQGGQPAWAILPPTETAAAIRPCSRRIPELGGVWSPDAADVRAAEAVLDRITAANYYRQYVGALLDGKRVLYFVGLFKPMVDRRPRLIRWRSEAFRGCDFGQQVFGATFDPTTRGFVSFDFDH